MTNFPMFRHRDRVRHKETGVTYRIVDLPTRLRTRNSLEPCYSYTRDTGEDITLWVLPQRDMEDGRFERVGGVPL